MIIGIGLDVVEISRINKLLERFGERFVQKILTKKERESIFKKKDLKNFIASNFAGKEALSKALGLGLVSPVTLQNISVMRNEQGAPQFEFNGPLQNYISSRKINHCHISISHDKGVACAMVVLESLF